MICQDLRVSGRFDCRPRPNGLSRSNESHNILPSNLQGAPKYVQHSENGASSYSTGTGLAVNPHVVFTYTTHTAGEYAFAHVLHKHTR